MQLCADFFSQTRAPSDDGSPVRIEDLPILIDSLERQMKEQAKAMEFEKASEVRSEIIRPRQLMGFGGGQLGKDRRKTKWAQRR